MIIAGREPAKQRVVVILPRTDPDHDVSILITAMERRPIARRGAGPEPLDDHHATAAAWTRVRERFGLVGLGTAVIPGLGLCRRHVQQAARSSDVVGAGAAGKQAVVANAVEAVRQDVDQEAADELVGRERHDLLAITTIGTIVLPSEGDAGAVTGDQPAVGDGDAVGIARQIGQHGLGPPNGRLA